MPEKIGRRNFEIPTEADAPDIPLWFKNVMNQLQNDAETGQGKLSERPAAGERGRLYYVTEGGEKGLWWDNGSAWVSTTAAGTVGDENLVKGRALVETENKFQGEQARTWEVEYEPSATRMTQVTIWWINAAEKESTLTVGGFKAGKWQPNASSSNGWLSFSFLCPPGQKWMMAGPGGGSLHSSYLTL